MRDNPSVCLAVGRFLASSVLFPVVSRTNSSRVSHLFAALVGRTSCLKHLACTFPVVL
nr:MAG TPA: hypothetical protein [Caudoviricetes sp.]